MTPPEALAHYSAMFQAARDGRMEILNEDGSLSDYRFVVGRIERSLLNGRLDERDLETLRGIARVFRAAKGERDGRV